MENYQNSEIYGLFHNNSLFYVGSTMTGIKKRFLRHTSDFKNGFYKHRYITVNDWDQVEVRLLEAYPCESKKDLELRERYWIEKLTPCGNDRIPCRTKQEWRIANKETIREYKKNWDVANAEHIRNYRNQRKDAKDALILSN